MSIKNVILLVINEDMVIRYLSIISLFYKLSEVVIKFNSSSIVFKQ
jgi:hypothetical protein